MLEPADIERKQFTATRIREGYDQDEVDAFLDQVAVDFAERDKQVDSLQQQIRRLKRDLDAARQPVPQDPDQPSLESVKAILVAAQKTADQAVADAHAQAGQIVIDARTEARQIVSASHTERQKQIDALEQRRVELAALINDLGDKREELTKWLKGALEAVEAHA
ncbi:hypothetical protein C6N75_10055 [Streptomyces solincola]|uniref:Cell wall synthesis protein Wag31 n=1 Tax=Streptomyces solincola TaxID=2100817 RepID=A0A2S9PYC6_9ACTN|nr:DivIVA domain-containing protein [Streptomyces solincola]PRH79415.1 hypothetical protein C6N75_10055 [Streptomyces solincola]